MILIKHNSLKPDIFFNPIFIPGFSGSRSRVRVQVLEVARKKGQICKDVFGIFKLLHYYFLSEHFPKFIFSGVLNSIVGCRLFVHLHLKRTPKHKFFWIFSNFVSVQLFKTPSWNNLWQSLVEFWAVDYSLVF